ncbi:MAG: hypothetical protein JWO89_1876, partial [Verrucomicrobiaceae bacterium]|nr:hypothetical protein [Verrucomicrobiaceae bacterium]
MSASHHEWLLSQLPEWEREGLLTPEAAVVLRERTQTAGARGGQLGLFIFGAIGSLLVGGGIIALLAHNWDDLPRWARLVFAFIPMAAGQVLAAWALKKGASMADWVRECVAVFLAIGAGTALAIVSQVYSMGGSWETFLMAWCLLSAPVMWLLRSTTVASLYLIGISVWAQRNNNWWGYHQSVDWGWYSLLLIPLLGWWPGLQWRPLQAPPLGFRWVAAICLLVFVASGGASDHMDLTLALGAVYVLLPETETRLSRRPFVVVGSLVLLVWGFLFSWAESHGRDIHDHPPLASMLPFLLLAVLAVALAVPAVRARRWAVLALASITLMPLFAAVVPVAALWLVASLQLMLIGVLMV